MSSVNDTLDELEQTPDDLLTPVKNDFKPQFTLTDDITDSMNVGKEDIAPGQKDNIITPEIEEEAEVINTGDSEENNTDTTSAGDGVTTFNLSELIPPATAIDIMELLIVFLGMWAVAKFFKTELDKEHLKFTPEEKATLKKPLERCFKETQTKTKNPWIALLIAFVAIMAIKGMTIYAIIQEQKKNNEEEPEENPTPIKNMSKKKRKSGGGRPPGAKNKIKLQPPPVENTDIIV